MNDWKEAERRMQGRDWVIKQIAQLNFDECIKIYELLDDEHPLVDFILEQMQTVDSERFDEWL